MTQKVICDITGEMMAMPDVLFAAFSVYIL